MFWGIFFFFYYLKGNYEPVLEKKAGVYYLPCQEEREFTFPKVLLKQTEVEEGLIKILQEWKS